MTEKIRSRRELLQRLVDIINKITNSPNTQWTEFPDGKYTANIGHFKLDYAYGGVQLEQIINPGGGVTLPLGSNRYTERELEIQLRAFIEGLRYRG